MLIHERHGWQVVPEDGLGQVTYIKTVGKLECVLRVLVDCSYSFLDSFVELQVRSVRGDVYVQCNKYLLEGENPWNLLDKSIGTLMEAYKDYASGQLQEYDVAEDGHGDTYEVKGSLKVWRRFVGEEPIELVKVLGYLHFGVHHAMELYQHRDVIAV